MQNQFKAASGKYLGIWNDYVQWSKLHNTYGFRMIYVDNVNEQDAAKNAGFQYDSMMVRLHWFASAYSEIEATNQGIREAGFYFIDEPFEHDTWTTLQILNVEAYLNNNYPGELLTIASYRWPSLWYAWPVSYGDKYTAVLNSYGNEYIQCDEYGGNCMGGVDDHWTEFRDYYGSYNCTMGNWVHIVINNGNGDQLCDPTGGGGGIVIGRANSWYELLGDANENGVNKIWLYAFQTGDENGIIAFCNSAWRRAWLLRLSKHYVVRWKCISPSPCTNCAWPDRGAWVIDYSYYDGQYQWISY